MKTKILKSELSWGSVISLLYIIVGIVLHKGYKEDIWQYFMIGGFIGTFIITSFSKKNLKHTMGRILLFALILAVYVYAITLYINIASEGDFLFENFIDWSGIYSLFAMGTVSGLIVKGIRNLLLKLSSKK